MKRCLKTPSLSITDKQLELLPYPVLGSHKLDGFRCCIVDGLAKTRSMKNIQNTFVFNQLSKKEFTGLDGELIIGPPNSPEAFHNTSGPLRRFDGKPDFTFYIFDRCAPGSYLDRWYLPSRTFPRFSGIQVIKQTTLLSPQEVIDYTSACVSEGYEGAMIRTFQGLYKQGRATFKEMNIFKRKPMEDDEAQIIGFVEQMTNINEKFVNELGLTKRSSNSEGKIPADTLGSFILHSPKWPRPFTCGGGCLLHSERKEIWDNQAKYLGKKVTYKFQAYGSIDGPRQPVFRRFFKEI